ncbi:hypothetical protein KCP69_20080 [Salmonella enterica subsp. enterica]|nr:hypothetical protein KCP69_20080 [Salmonella enterica subsp. enterica]
MWRYVRKKSCCVVAACRWLYNFAVGEVAHIVSRRSVYLSVRLKAGR